MRLLAFVAAILLLIAGSAHAQTIARVVRPQSTIYNPGFTTVAAVVPAGTELTVVGREGMWYRVVLPFPDGTRQTGFIAIGQVEIVSGTPPPAAPARTAPAPGARQRQPQRAASQPSRTGPLPSAVGFRPFGQAGYGWTNARDSFKALFGSAGWLWYGGGAQYTFSSGLFVQSSGDLFWRSGNRVFATDDEVFDLGIKNTITMLPLAGTVGYRFAGRKMAPYVGGGMGLYLYREDFDFAESGEAVNEHFPSYHALGGVEFRHSPRISSAIEVQYTHVTNDFSGLADVFDEHNLGGLQVRGKLLFGGR